MVRWHYYFILLLSYQYIIMYYSVHCFWLVLVVVCTINTMFSFLKFFFLVSLHGGGPETMLGEDGALKPPPSRPCPRTVSLVTAAPIRPRPSPGGPETMLGEVGARMPPLPLLERPQAALASHGVTGQDCTRPLTTIAESDECVHARTGPSLVVIPSLG